MKFGTTRSFVACCLLMLAVLVGVGCGPAVAQAPAPPADMPQRTPPVENAQPDAFYLRDENGTMVLVPNLTWEEYDRIMRPSEGRLGPLPYYSLITTAIQGRVKDDRAELTIRLELSVDRDSEQAFGIPLRLRPAILRETRYEGFGKAVLAFEREANGYVCWLEAPARTRHVITLQMVVPIKRTGDQSQLELELPEALTHVELVLPLDEPNVEVEGDQFLLKPPQSLLGGGSKVEVDAFGGDLKLQWREAAATQRVTRPSLTVNSQVTYLIGDPTYVRAEALLELRSDPGEFGTFHVRLPPGMDLLTRDTAGYSVQTVETSSSEGNLLRIDLESSRERAATIRLSAKISRDEAVAAEPLQVIGFVVPEAYYQRSDLVLTIDGDWSVRTVEAENVRRVDTLSDAERKAGAIAKYLWIANRTQPSSLQLAIQPQESLITIDPLYVLHFSEQKARLDAVLKFHVRGAAARGIDFWVGDWKMREITPPEILAAAPLEASDDPTVLPIRFAANQLPASGEFEVRISLERPIPLNNESLRLSLPRPASSATSSDSQATDTVSEGQEQSITITPATLITEADEDLDFAPLLPSMPDFSQSSADPLPLLPESIRSTLTSERLLHFQAAATDKAWQFVCMVRPRPQSITATSRLDLKIEGTRIDATQTFDLQVAHQPLQQVLLEAPKAIAGATLWFNDQPLSTITMPKLPSAERMSISATLPVPQSGHVILRLRYSIAAPANMASDPQWKLTIPAAVLVNDPPVSSVDSLLVIAHDHPSWQFNVAGAQWQPANLKEQPASANLAALEAKGAFSTINLEVTSRSALEGPTVVRGAWYQTVYTGPSRVDRAVFRLSSPRSRVELELPLVDGRAPTEVMVAVDGREPENMHTTSDRLVVVDLAQQSATEEHVVEVWYSINVGQPRAGSPIGLVQLRGASGVYVSYWHLVLPRSTHLIADPAGLTPEYRWQWRGPFWQRTPNLTQHDLEQWIGATRADEVAAATNQYLFSSFGSPSEFRVWTVSRSLLVLLVSGAVLFIGLALVHVPSARHPAVLLLLAVAAVGLALVRPGYGILLAQAGLAGFVLVVGSRLVERLFVRRRSLVHVSRASSYLPAEPVPRERVPQASGVPLGTTASAPMAVEVSSGEIDL